MFKDCLVVHNCIPVLAKYEHLRLFPVQGPVCVRGGLMTFQILNIGHELCWPRHSEIPGILNGIRKG